MTRPRGHEVSANSLVIYKPGEEVPDEVAVHVPDVEPKID